MVSFFEGERRERKRERGRDNQSRDHHHGDVIINNVGHTRRQHSTDSPRKRSRFSAEMASDSTSNTLDALDALSIAPVSPFLLPFSLPLPLLSSLTLSLSLSLSLPLFRSFFLSFFLCDAAGAADISTARRRFLPPSLFKRGAIYGVDGKYRLPIENSGKEIRAARVSSNPAGIRSDDIQSN